MQFSRRKRYRQLRAAEQVNVMHLVAAMGSSMPCPCLNPAHCTPINFGHGPSTAAREIFGFGGGDGSTLDFTRVTTVAWVSNSELMCRAHAAGARAIMAAPNPESVLSSDASARAAWVTSTVNAVRASYLDGVVFDWESPCPVGSPLQFWYAVLINETRAVLQAISPGYQVSTCVPHNPDDIDGRGYDVKTMAIVSDFLYVMDYDTRSQIYDACIAAANAPLAGTLYGLRRYFDVGVRPQQLVLGVPWYGYRYQCLPGAAATSRFCPIQMTPFRGVNCSDAAGLEVSFHEIVDLISNASAKGWDANQAAPWANVITSSGGTIQFWYDDVRSLTRKYLEARYLGLLGVGPFTFTDVLSASDKMYAAFDAFLGSSTSDSD